MEWKELKEARKGLNAVREHASHDLKTAYKKDPSLASDAYEIGDIAGLKLAQNEMTRMANSLVCDPHLESRGGGSLASPSAPAEG